MPNLYGSKAKESGNEEGDSVTVIELEKNTNRDVNLSEYRM